MFESEEKYFSLGIQKEVLENNKHLKIAVKFRAYRLEAESKNKKLKEAEIVIDQLKSELNFSRDAEKNLRNQISLGQSRLICFQEALKKFINVSDKQRQNEKNCHQIEQKVEKLKEEIEQGLVKVQNLYECISREAKLLKKIDKLESAMIITQNEYDLIKREVQTLTNEKKNMETEFQQRLKNLENKLKKAITNEAEIQAYSREMSLNYEAQIEDYKQKIESYEKERKSFLEDFEPPKNLEINFNNATPADKTISCNADDRSPKTSVKRDKIKTNSEEPDTKIFQCSSFQIKSKLLNLKKEKNINFYKSSKKQKPQLEFLTRSQDSLPKINTAECSRKRRLFSTNHNHYID